MRQQRSCATMSGVSMVLAVALVLPMGSWAASKYKVLHKFTGQDGQHPYAGLIFDAKGNLYGTTRDGGSNSSGTVFKLTPNANGSWTESVLYSFCSLNSCADGSTPLSGLIFGATGSLYGTTAAGQGGGSGVVFQLKPRADGSWTESVLHRFTGPPDGLEPAAGLTFDTAGNLYGTTIYGGSGPDCGSFGCGVVFELTPNADGSWNEKVVYSFCSLMACADGALAIAGLIFDTAGSLYGTTAFGGSGSACTGSPSGCGVAFKLTPHTDGNWTESVLHSFTDSVDGGGPEAGLTPDAAGSLYGTSVFGGSLCGNITCGVVFKLKSHLDGRWTEGVLHSFKDHPAAQPHAALIFDPTGNLYGTAANDTGVSGYGAVFKLAPTQGGGWVYTVLHTFRDKSASFPHSSLALDSAGNLYGTAEDCDGGNNCYGNGVVFQVSP